MGVGVGQVVGRFDALHVIATCLIEVNHLRRSRQLYTPFKSQSVNLLPLVCYSTPSLRHPAMQVCLISDLGFVLSQLHHLLLRLSVSDDSRHQDTNSLDLVLVDRARSNIRESFLFKVFTRCQSSEGHDTFGSYRDLLNINIHMLTKRPLISCIALNI